jgi:hypothetical protein
MSRKAALRVGSILLALSAMAMDHAQAGSLTPLQDANCPMPPALRSVRGHALLRYIVSSTGAVESIEEVYVTAEPADRQGDFAAALRSCLARWRYKNVPTVQNIALPVQMLMAFHYFEPAPDGAPSVTLPDGRSLPRLHLEEMRRERRVLASRLLAGPGFAEVRAHGCTVLTNVSAGQRAELIESIDRATGDFSRVFPAAASRPASPELVIFLFKDESSFREVAAFDNLVRMSGWIAGQYSSLDQTAYAALGDGPPRIAIDTLVHEVTHHLIHQNLFKDGRRPPYWVNEGIATFVELLRPGRTQDISRHERGMQRQGSFRWRSEADVYLESLSRASREGTQPELGAFLSGSPSIGKLDSDLAYGLSWLIVHFLINGDGQAYRERFETWLLATADAAHGDSVLSAVGLTLDDFEGRLAAHRKRLRKAAY